MAKFVYFFGSDETEGNAGMKALLGGKGANLAEMANLGMPVPPGFTITTEACKLFYENGKRWPAGLKKEIKTNIAKLQKIMNASLGDPSAPLLLSVRSGAASSMPGMMDTVLNLGLNERVIEGLITKTGNPVFVWDAYRRFIQMFGNVVMNINPEEFENALHLLKNKKNLSLDIELTTDHLKELVKTYKAIYKKHTKENFPDDSWVQLENTINAVFLSWNNSRAIFYRKQNNINGLLGTAVNVQSMVLGNMGKTSGTGVCFSRNPANGTNEFYGEFLMNAQGEDVVAGIRTPDPIRHLAKINKNVYNELLAIKDKLEKHYRDMQDMEFTIQQGKLFMLQTRTGKRTATAALKIAMDMVREGLISKEEAMLRIAPESLDQFLHPNFDPKAEKTAEILTKGLPASPGSATGKVVFSAEDANIWTARGEKVILVRSETSPEDIAGMYAASGILTGLGGMTSHAAVVARGIGKCCIVGAGAININTKNKTITSGNITVKEGDFISLNGSTGTVYAGQIKTVPAILPNDFKILMSWADKTRRLGIRANCDTQQDAENALKFGAEGIGLCRTEHMFFDDKRIISIRKMILAENAKKREEALNELLPLQRKDFEDIFKTMKNKPVTIRLIDPPLHEFVPHDDKSQKAMASALKMPLKKIKEKVSELHEFNPMLGHRGCRLGITFPEIIRMQTRAIIEAAINIKNKLAIRTTPEIMIPLVGETGELIIIKNEIESVIQQVFKEKGVKIPYLIGTMIEVPRAALIADSIAKKADFFSFGTNDLTQMTCGFSRDDAGSFLKEYVENNIFAKDPFQVIDQEGVGQLVKIGVERGRSVNKKLKIGICGEHGGEPSSVEFFHSVGMDYVSCSPFRVPLARLSAAQAVIKGKV